jgi:hypothetical protein
MADARPFRFLDLPKELRLMVYERLPVKTIRHPFEFNEPGHPFNDDDFDPILDLVDKTLSGLPIIATCRQINFEATPILDRVLRMIKSALIQLIANAHGISSARLENLMECISFSPLNCTGKNDLRKLISIEGDKADLMTHKFRSTTDIPARQVHIAIKNDPDYYPAGSYVDENADNPRDDFQDSLYDDMDINVRHTRGLHVRLSLALLSVEDKTAFVDYPFINNYSRGFGNRHEAEIEMKLTIHYGLEINEVGWEADWAEGERYE